VGGCDRGRLISGWGWGSRGPTNLTCQLRPDLAVVYMTGYTRNAIVHNGALDAGTRLLTKPFTVEQLERELRLALADRVQS